MISSDLIKKTDNYNNISYLIFAGFCLVTAIFSRRFITTIGERILEAAKKAEVTSSENKEQIEKTKLELTSTQERIEDVKLAVNLNNPEFQEVNVGFEDPKLELIELVNTYLERTHIPDYTERLKVKAELGRKMGQIIIRNNLPKEQLLNEIPKEGMCLALAYAVELKPYREGVALLSEISKITTQMYTKYVMLIAYRTLASSGMIKKEQVPAIYKIVTGFRLGADRPLHRNIDDTISVLKFINPKIED